MIRERGGRGPEGRNRENSLEFLQRVRVGAHVGLRGHDGLRLEGEEGGILNEGRESDKEEKGEQEHRTVMMVAFSRSKTKTLMGVLNLSGDFGRNIFFWDPPGKGASLKYH